MCGSDAGSCGSLSRRLVLSAMVALEPRVGLGGLEIASAGPGEDTGGLAARPLAQLAVEQTLPGLQRL